MSPEIGRFSSFHIPFTKSQQETTHSVQIDICDVPALRNALLCFHFFDPFERGVLDLDNARKILSNVKNPALVELLNEVLYICKGCVKKEEFIWTLYKAVQTGFCADLKEKDNVITDYFKGLGGEELTDRQSLASSRKSSARGAVLVERRESMRSRLSDKSATNSVVYSRRVSDAVEELNDDDVSDCTFQPKINSYKLKDRKQNELFNKEVEEILHFKNECTDQRPLTEYIVFHYNSQMEWKSTLRG